VHMDPERKTLAELSKEVREKKYITLDTASKLSGYTIEYLERLCRLDKLEHRLIAKGGFAIELQSLLRETHTLLISDSEIDFVDQRELAPPVVEVATQIEAPLVEPITLPVARLPREPEVVVPPTPPVPPATPTSIYSEYGDEWDALLLGSAAETSEIPAPPAPPVSLYHTPSVYRPVTTSVDPLPHRDTAPLFPVLDKGGVQKEEMVAPPAPVLAPIPTPPAPVVAQTPILVPPAPVVVPQQVFVAPVIAAPAPVPPPVFTPLAPPSPPISTPVLGRQVVGNAIAPTLSAQGIPPLATAHALAQAQTLTPAPSVSHLPEISPEHHLAIPESHALMEE
jgi:hypothetical protein